MQVVEFEVGVAVDLPDGKYGRGQVHAVGAKAAVLQQFIPYGDKRYGAVLVKDGVVYAQEWHEPATDSAPASPSAQAEPEAQPEPEAVAAATEPAAKKKPQIFFPKK